MSSLKDPSGRLSRWHLKLKDYNFTVVYKSGNSRLNSDSLSRYPLPSDGSQPGLKHPPDAIAFLTPLIFLILDGQTLLFSLSSGVYFVTMTVLPPAWNDKLSFFIFATTFFTAVTMSLMGDRFC